jgi:glycerophosphoryl diester phosphodiesterase
MSTLQTLSSAVKVATDAATTATSQANIATLASKAAAKAGAQVSSDAGAAEAAASQALDARDAINNRLYPGFFAAPPTTRPNGSGIQDGDQYTDTDGVTWQRRGGVWADFNNEAAESADLADLSRIAAEEAEGVALTQAGIATTGAGTATAQAVIATTKADEASTSAGSAAAAKVAAEAARDSVNTTGKVYASTAAGIAGVADGQTFAVLDVTLQFWNVYQRVGAAANLVATSYTKAYLDALLHATRNTAGEYLSVRDEQGFSRFVGNDAGFGTATEKVIPTGLQVAGFDLVSDGAGGFGVKDLNGFYLFRVKADGTTLANNPATTANAAAIAINTAAIAALLAPDAPSAEMELIAHRGFRVQAPQNTLLAWSTALARGADSLETDVSVSADGTLYVFHDTTVEALTFGAGTFTALTDANIAALKFRQLAGTALADVPVPKFVDLLKFAKSAGVTVYPEFKNIRTLADVDAIVAAVVAAGMVDQCVFQSFTLGHLAQVRTTNTSVRVSYIVSDGPQYISFADQVASLGRGSLTADASGILANPDASRTARARTLASKPGRSTPRPRPSNS